jgi:hypothetical protein
MSQRKLLEQWHMPRGKSLEENYLGSSIFFHSASEFLLSVLSFVVDIMEKFQRNSDTHGKQKAMIQRTCAKN